MENRQTIDARVLARMFLAGAKNLEAKKEWINELNVFPVPDGDTGTNMTLTILSAASEVSALEDPDMATLGKAISSGSLRGARGNSGVILSQLLRGFTKSVNKQPVLDATAIAAAMDRAVETAYKAVMKPKEGTILTVAREAAVKAGEIAEASNSLEIFFREIFEHAQNTLEKTPEMLPVLKEAGVVDSGGQGLLEIFRGAMDGYLGKVIDYAEFAPSTTPKVTKITPETEAEITFGYCTEFIILLNEPLQEEVLKQFKAFLISIGDSIVLVADDEIVKVHVHTNHPGLAFEEALKYGALSRMKVDNMREEHQEKLIHDAERLAREQAGEDHLLPVRENAEKPAASSVQEDPGPRKPYGFISVTVGDGLSAIFRDLGVDRIIEGGQTMNPSTDDLIHAIEQVNADTVFILPNNKNIILAANQAKDMVENKEVIVVPTATVPQGITAVISFIPEKDPKENLSIMTRALETVHTGQITYAVRDTRLDAKEIHEGDIMGIGDHGILSVGSSINETAMDMVAAMVDDASEVISIYSGQDVATEDAEALAASLQEAYGDCEVELNTGGQPVYYYIISVE